MVPGRDTSVAHDAASDQHAHDVYTLANIITVLRLMLVPLFFAVLLSDRSDVFAFALFAVAASTDWLDGQIARRTGTVTEIGKAIDPLVDRLLIAAGVIGLFLIGRIPLWMPMVLLARDAFLLGGAMVLARSKARRPPVIFIGKATTMLLMAGFSGLILNWPKVPGAGVINSTQLPGLGPDSAAVWIWFIYSGIITSTLTAVIYVAQARKALQERHASA
jgi:cardiolipin synthase